MKTSGIAAITFLSVIVIASRALGATCGGPAAGGEWRSYGHDHANSRHQAEETTIGVLQAATLGELWSHSATSWGGSGDFPGTPVIADGCLYAGSTKGWVFAANADTGELVWSHHFQDGGATYGSVAVEGGKIFVGLSSPGSPSHLKVAALNQVDGSEAWITEVDNQNSSEIYSSATYFDGLVIVGISGGAAELSSEDVRDAFHGNIVILDAATGGSVINKKIYTVPLGATEPTTGTPYAGGGVWAPTPAIDTDAKYGYFSVGNPFNEQFQYPNTDAVIKVDLDQTRTTFATIVGRYPGNIDKYYPQSNDLPCVAFPASVYPRGLGACGDLDLDFGTSPNIFTVNDKQLVGAGQKSGVYHAFDPAVRADGTMAQAWTALVGLPSAVGGIVGSATYDGSAITGPITQLGYLWSVNASDGLYRWLAPVIDVAHYGQPVTSANGVVYTVDLKGFIDAYDAATGVPVLHRPMAIGSLDGPSPLKQDPILSLGGVAVARNTVYASVGTIGALNGYIIAYRPATLPVLAPK
jgi:polyvinyl alcohol dehydrogenase (cytochrome)